MRVLKVDRHRQLATNTWGQGHSFCALVPQLLLSEYLLEQYINKMAFANGLGILLLTENEGNVLPFRFSTKDSISSTYGEPS